LIIKYGFGVYNQSHNIVSVSILRVAIDLHVIKNSPIVGSAAMLLTSKYGENPLSLAGIDAGVNYIKNK
jgi:hypothetical protein